MADTIKVKMKVGEHEIDAEGPPDIVQAQVEMFRDLVAKAGAEKSYTPPVNPATPHGTEERTVTGPFGNPEDNLNKIMRVDGRVVSLTARPANVEDAALLVLYGQKVLRQNEGVTGNEILQGLAMTGLAAPRADRVLDKPIQSNLAMATGMNRGRRYRLSNMGNARARELAKELIATVA